MTDSKTLDLVRSIYADWERGDFSSAEWADPDIEYVIADGPTPGNWTGHAGLWEAFRDFVGAWDELHVEAAEYRELDDEHVLVLTRLSGRGKTSGMELEQMRANGADILQLRDGKVTRFVLNFDRERALADLGLDE
jgi:ketosteroid isomerase-like protein